MCDPIAQASCLVTFIPYSNDRPRGAVQNVAVSPQPSSATEFFAQKDVSRIKVCGNVLRSAWLRLKFKPGRPELCQRWADQNQRSFCMSFAHDACALKPGPAEALLRDKPFGRSHLKSDARVDTSTARYIRCLCPLNAPRSCHPNQEQNRVRIDLEGEVLQASSRLSNNCFPAREYDGLFAFRRIIRCMRARVAPCGGSYAHRLGTSARAMEFGNSVILSSLGFTMTYVSSDDMMSALARASSWFHVDGKITTGIEGLRKNR